MRWADTGYGVDHSGGGVGHSGNGVEHSGDTSEAGPSCFCTNSAAAHVTCQLQAVHGTDRAHGRG
eukprot:2844219-Rhodomonas_salina.1